MPYKTVPILALLGATLATPALAQDRQDRGPDDRGGYELRGRGVELLVPELRDDPRGRAFVMRRFDFNHDGYLSPEEAREANRSFRSRADGRGRPEDRGGYDDRGRPDDRGQGDRGRYDRRGPEVVTEEQVPLPLVFRAYHPRQTRYGATIDFGDVLFATDRADLRPGARDRLAALADFLRSHPRIRIRVDGYTDSRASAAHNQQLSEARARSVAAALARLGLDPARFETAGHGEAEPVASNDTPGGRQQNRRVEVTLIGQRADRFGR